MAVESQQIRQKIDSRISDIQMEMLENFAALVEAGLPPVVAEKAAKRIAEIRAGQAPAAQPPAQPQPRSVTAQQALQRGTIIRNPERERAIAAIGKPPEVPGFLNTTLEKLAARNENEPNTPPGYVSHIRDARNYINRRNAAYALPEYIDSPVQQAINPALQISQPETKEREEKHHAETAQQARESLQAPGTFGNDRAPPRLAALDPAHFSAYALANNPPDFAQPGSFLKDARAESAMGAQGFPQNRQAYMNPYIQDVVNKIRQEGLRTFNEGILPALESKFVRMGQHGGSRHATLAQRAARDMQSSIANAQGQALHAGYGQAGQLFNSDQMRRMANSENIKGLGLAGQASNLANIGALSEVGKTRQSHEQQKYDIAFQDWLRQREEPFLRLAQQAAIMKGAHVPMMQESYQYRPPEQQLNNWGNAASVSAQLLGGLMQRPRGRKSGGRVTLNLRGR